MSNPLPPQPFVEPFKPSSQKSQGTGSRRSVVLGLGISAMRRLARRVHFAAALAVFAGVAAGHAQTGFGPIAIGASSSVTVAVTMQAGGTVNTVEVLTQGASGLDFTAASGGTCAGGTFSTGQRCNQPVLFKPAYPGGRTGAVVLLDSTGKVLATSYLAGTGLGGLGALIPGTAQTLAGDGRWQDSFVGDGNLATQAELFLPSAVALDGAGNLYIADSNHNRIRMVCAGTTATIAGTTCSGAGIISTIAGVDGTSGYAGDSGAAGSQNTELNLPSGVAIDGAGNLFIADSANNVVREISAATGVITTIAGTHTAGFSGDGGAAVAAKLNQPFGLALDPAGNLFIADIGNNRVRVVCAAAGTLDGAACPARGAIVTVAGNGSAGATGDGGQAIAAELNGPYAVAVDPAGNLFLADTQNNRVRAVCATASSSILGTHCTAAGIISTVAGNGTGNFAGDGGAASAAEVNSPSGLAFDPAGDLYIADTQNYRIREVTAKSAIISTIAGNGSADFGGDDGPATDAGIHGPYGIVLDNNGNLIVADFFDQRIRTIQTNLTQVSITLPVRQGYTSDPVPVTVANIGTDDLALTSLVAGINTAIDPATTTCPNGGSLTVMQTCVVSVEFAPAKTPTLSGNQAEGGIVDVNDETQAGIVGSNSPLVIEVGGTATPVNATDVALTSKPNPSTFGQNVLFTATVTTGSGTGALTGTVSFFDGATKISPDLAVNASGVATFATSSLAVGTHTITAAYNGDTGHFSSVSPNLKQVVNEATSTALVSSANPSTLNQSVTFTATVKATGGVAPDGTVTFMDGANVLGTQTLSGTGTATFTTSTLADGLHSITAVYSGDAAIYVQGSTSNAVKQDVLAGSTVELATSGSPSIYGAAVTFTATVTTNGTSAPTGTVKFLDGTTKIGSGTLVGTTGVATFTTSSLAVGSHAITAAYVGDSSDGPGTSTPVTQVVNQADTATTVSAAPDPGIAGEPVTLTAKVALTTGSAALTGTVTFTDGTATLGTSAVSSGGSATLSQALAPGAHSIVATYSGDTNDKGSASAPLALTVNQATTTVTLTTSGTPAQVLSAVQFKAVVSGNGGMPTGKVTFSVDGITAGSSAVDATGTATLTDSGLAVGTHSVTAKYAGDTNDAGSASAALSQVITAIPTTTGLGTSTTGGKSPQTILVATTYGTTGPIPTGIITFMEGTTVVGSGTLDAGGVATLVPELAPGSHTIVASYGGDAVHSPSQSASVTIKGSGNGFSIVVDPPKMTLVSGENGTFTVSVVSNNGFSDDIGMGCLSLPAAVNCHFAAASVKLGANDIQTVQLTIDTNAPLSGGQSASTKSPGGGGLTLAGLFLPVSLLFGAWFWRLRRKHGAALLAAAVCFLAGAISLSGCGGSFSQISAAPGTYTIQVGGVGSGSNTSHYQNVTLTVTK
jgi:large repetitive protein